MQKQKSEQAMSGHRGSKHLRMYSGQALGILLSIHRSSRPLNLSQESTSEGDWALLSA
jgi:hypothetical protein